MPTSSLYTDLVIDTPEAARNFLKAFELREKLGPVKIGEIPKLVTDPVEIRKLFGIKD